MDFFISPAYAEAGAAAAGQSSATGQIIMLVGFVLIFYFLLWRPQRKRQQEHQALVGGLNKGDEVVFAGGLLGRITKVEEEFVAVEIADNLEVKVQKAAVMATLPKGTIKNI